MATLLFLGASVSQLPAIRYARESGHRVVAVDGDPDAVAFEYCDVAECVDFTDVDLVTEVAIRHSVEGVLAISTDRAVPPAAAISARLGLAGIGSDVALAMTDKARMRSVLDAAGVPQPRHRTVSREDELEKACVAVGFPAVLKPADSGGQRGIFLVRSVDQARNALAESLAFSRGGHAMLEQYVEGTELNGILVARDGEPTVVTLSDRLRPRGVGFGVGWIHSYPSSLPPDVLAEVERVAIDAVRALGLRDGIAFPQLLAAADGTVRIVEVAARIAAGQMADLVRFGTGVNLFDVAFEQALGHPVPDALITPSNRRPIAIRFLTAKPGVLPVGTVESIDGLDDVRAAPGVLAADLYFGPGVTIGPLQVDADRRGYVIATGESTTRALELADAAARKLVVRTTEPSRARFFARPLQSRRLVPVALVLAAAFAAAFAFVITEHSKLHRTLLLGARVSRTFAPMCHCPRDVAHVSFRVAQAGRITVQMVNSAGKPVATFLRDRSVGVGPQRFVWRGLDGGHALPDGRYVPEVVFPSLHQTLRLPSIALT